MQQGKFIKIYNIFSEVVFDIQNLFKNYVFLQTLTSHQLNGISFFYTSLNSRNLLLFISYFIFFIFENVDLMFIFKFKKFTKIARKKKKKKYYMDYSYVAPKLRLFKAIKI